MSLSDSDSHFQKVMFTEDVVRCRFRVANEVTVRYDNVVVGAVVAMKTIV